MMLFPATNNFPRFIVLFHQFEGIGRQRGVRRLNLSVTFRIPNLKAVEQSDQHRVVLNARAARHLIGQTNPSGLVHARLRRIAADDAFETTFLGSLFGIASMDCDQLRHLRRRQDAHARPNSLPRPEDEECNSTAAFWGRHLAGICTRLFSSTP